MSNTYQLNFTGKQIDERLSKIDTLESGVESLNNKVKDVVTSVNGKTGNVEITSTCDLAQPRWGQEFVSVYFNSEEGTKILYDETHTGGHITVRIPSISLDYYSFQFYEGEEEAILHDVVKIIYHPSQDGPDSYYTVQAHVQGGEIVPFSGHIEILKENQIHKISANFLSKSKPIFLTLKPDYSTGTVEKIAGPDDESLGSLREDDVLVILINEEENLYLANEYSIVIDDAPLSITIVTKQGYITFEAGGGGYWTAYKNF